MKKKPLLIYVNPESSGVREFKLSFKKIIITIFLVIFGSLITLKLSIDFFVEYSQNSKISQLKKEKGVIQAEFEKIREKISKLSSNINLLEEKDDQLRALLDLPPITPDERKVGVGGADPNISSFGEQFSFSKSLTENLKLLNKLEREIRFEKESYQKLLTTVERQQDSLRYLPVLKPVPSAYVSSGFGNRMHPIRKVRHFHRGIDLSALRGNPIIAPADGQVVAAGRNGGYGLEVQIDHKYGFKTRYGHMQKIYVRKGQFVKRGAKIGEVGRTGLATSSHLHYEIFYKGKPLNPINFYFND